MTLTIGQSLTPEQVRDLPDGAVVEAIDSHGGVVAVIKREDAFVAESGSHYCFCESCFGGDFGWRSATLVSLPTTEPAEPILVQCDLCKMTYPQENKHDCRPLVGSTPRPVREIESIQKRAALALAEMLVIDLRDLSQSNGIYIMWTDVADACREYLQAFDYARSIGAIE